MLAYLETGMFHQTATHLTYPLLILKQGSLTEGEGSVQLTYSLR